MLAGRVGSAMAAVLGTMRVTEQIDALTTMGADPIHYLVVPRFMACIFLIPALTIMADFMGIVGGYFYSVIILGIDHAATCKTALTLSRDMISLPVSSRASFLVASSQWSVAIEVSIAKPVPKAWEMQRLLRS